MPSFEWQFTLVLITNGMLVGMMYALIALGFVLMYKATDAINFAQGEFVMFAGFVAAAAAFAGLPFWAAAPLSIAAHGGVLLRPGARRAAPADRAPGHRGHHGDDRPGVAAARRRCAGLRRRHAGDDDADRRQRRCSSAR